MRLVSILSSEFGHGERHSGAGWTAQREPMYTSLCTHKPLAVAGQLERRGKVPLTVNDA